MTVFASGPRSRRPARAGGQLQQAINAALITRYPGASVAVSSRRYAAAIRRSASTRCCRTCPTPCSTFGGNAAQRAGPAGAGLGERRPLRAGYRRGTVLRPQTASSRAGDGYRAPADLGSDRQPGAASPASTRCRRSRLQPASIPDATRAMPGNPTTLGQPHVDSAWRSTARRSPSATRCARSCWSTRRRTSRR